MRLHYANILYACQQLECCGRVKKEKTIRKSTKGTANKGGAFSYGPIG